MSRTGSQFHREGDRIAGRGEGAHGWAAAVAGFPMGAAAASKRRKAARRGFVVAEGSGSGASPGRSRRDRGRGRGFGGGTARGRGRAAARPVGARGAGKNVRVWTLERVGFGPKNFAANRPF